MMLFSSFQVVIGQASCDFIVKWEVEISKESTSCYHRNQAYLFSRPTKCSRSMNRLKSLKVTIILRASLVVPVFFNSVSTCLIANVALYIADRGKTAIW